MDQEIDPLDRSRGKDESRQPPPAGSDASPLAPSMSPEESERRLAAALAQIKRNTTNHKYVPSAVDVAHLRKRMGMTQTQFARRFGLSVATLRHWERGDRRPRGAALILLNVIEHNTQLALRALKPR